MNVPLPPGAPVVPYLSNRIEMETSLYPDRSLHTDLDYFVHTRAEGLRRAGYRIEQVDNPDETLAGITRQVGLERPIQIDKGVPVVGVFGSVTRHLDWRLWHDFLHVEHRLDFDRQGEVRTARLQAEEMRDPLLAAIVYATAWGLNQLLRATGGYPDNQRLFVYRCLERGVPQTVKDYLV